ncbi:3312_t:CDS:2 [Ambispora leptoticha]|uniref:3312_t:CDS:1 n=1 Tax=Ambispora leptoticha TaxID=144679 RepID=A0A9N8ZRF2_9GLOM|nr:3312_t:CDS:2 [Ambispora leptoticha]
MNKPQMQLLKELEYSRIPIPELYSQIDPTEQWAQRDGGGDWENGAKPYG